MSDTDFFLNIVCTQNSNTIITITVQNFVMTKSTIPRLHVIIKSTRPALKECKPTPLMKILVRHIGLYYMHTDLIVVRLVGSR